MKRFTSLILLLISSIFFISSTLPSLAEKINILPEIPEILTINGCELVTVLPLADMLDIAVTQVNKSYTFTRQRRSLTCTLQSTNALANGRAVKLTVAPFESYGTLYIPLVSLVTALGGTIEADEQADITRFSLPGQLPAVEMKRITIAENQREFRETDSELFIMDINGENITRLTYNNSEDELVFPNIIENSFYFSRNDNYYRRILNSPNPQAILRKDDNFSFTNLDWDDSMRVILGTRYHIGARSEFFAMNADGSGLRILARGAMPNLSPDGKRIVFNRCATADDECSIGLYTVATADVVTLAKGNDPCFSPDGAALIFSQIINRTDNKAAEMICSYTFNGADAGTFYQPSALEAAEDEISPYFTPDSQQIIFLAGNPSNIYLMKLDRSERHAITRDGGYGFARFIPDGSAILATKLCYNNTRHDIFRMGPEGEAPVRISGALKYKDIREFMVTPNGEQIIFSAAPELAE